MRPRSKMRVRVRKRCLARPSSQRGGLESEVSVVPLGPGLPIGEVGQSLEASVVPPLARPFGQRLDHPWPFA